MISEGLLGMGLGSIQWRFFEQGDVVGMDAADERINFHHLKARRFGFLLETAGLDHFDPCSALVHQASQPALEEMERVHPVKRDDRPRRGNPQEFSENRLSVQRIVDMVKKPNRKNDGEDVFSKRQSLLGIPYHAQGVFRGRPRDAAVAAHCPPGFFYFLTGALHHMEREVAVDDPKPLPQQKA